MASESVDLEYNLDLKPLEDLLSGVERPGDFFVSGKLDALLPRVEVDGVGVLSFPVLAAQIQEVIRQAERAPYGRGEKTVLDTSVRNAWQVATGKVRVGGKSWAAVMESILTQARMGLGCGGTPITAELYKLLVYEAGGFFKPHRDTEKTPGMFGTLTIALPAAAQGGELAIRHSGREAVVDLSGTEVSELTFAAFYADCEHEVRPVTEGYRVCLIYNLIQDAGAAAESKSIVPLCAPRYETEVGAAAALLKDALRPGAATVKLVWLLEHQYSSAGLSFAALKNADAARAKVLCAAASRAGCAVHLAMVHIEESGSALPQYREYYGRRYGGRHFSNDQNIEEGGNDDDFEIVEVTDGSQYLDTWTAQDDRAADFGQLPLGGGELLPAGALDDEAPDNQRLTEATGNEGASFERAYHRAALVLWDRERYAEVLLQGGVGAVLPYFRERIETCGTTSQRQEVVMLADLIVDSWKNTRQSGYWRAPAPTSRAGMIELLTLLDDSSMTARFVSETVVERYDGSENEALAAAAPLMGSEASRLIICKLIAANMRIGHAACVDLLRRLSETPQGKSSPEWRSAFREVATVLVANLREIGSKPPQRSQVNYEDWQRLQNAQPVNATQIADLLDTLDFLDAGPLRDLSTDTILADTALFDSGQVLTPALEALYERHGDSTRNDTSFARLWEHAANFLLARSEQPPEKPSNWRQNIAVSCKCPDCREMQLFLHDGQNQIRGFRVRQDRRSHLEAQIRKDGLDMTCVTDRKGSPQTLICTKTRRTYQRQCERHRSDTDSMRTLIRVSGDFGNGLAARLAAASVRSALP